MSKKNNIKIKVGNNIKKLRKKKGLTQSKLALKADLHRAYLGTIERGEKNIGLRNLEKIAEALDSDIRDLFG